MSIYMWTGRPGTGKTYSLVRVLLRKLDQGFIVYSNFYIDWNGYEESRSMLWITFKRFIPVLTLNKRFPFVCLSKRKAKSYPQSNLRSWSELEDLLVVENGIIAIDEAHMYLNSRRWLELPFEFQRKLAQHRKDGVNLYGTVQNVKRLDVIVRELIDFWYDCKKMIGFVVATEYDIDEDKMKRKLLSRTFFRFSRRWYRRYDTLEKIGSKKNTA